MSNSIHEIDNIKVEEPKKNEVEMVTCLCCGDVHEGNNDTPCPRCSKNMGQAISNTIYRTRFNKFAVSE